MTAYRIQNNKTGFVARFRERGKIDVVKLGAYGEILSETQCTIYLPEYEYNSVKGAMRALFKQYANLLKSRERTA